MEILLSLAYGMKKLGFGCLKFEVVELTVLLSCCFHLMCFSPSFLLFQTFYLSVWILRKCGKVEENTTLTNQQPSINSVHCPKWLSWGKFSIFGKQNNMKHESNMLLFPLAVKRLLGKFGLVWECFW